MKVTKIQDYEDGGATLELELSREELLFLAENGLHERMPENVCRCWIQQC